MKQSDPAPLAILLLILLTLALLLGRLTWTGDESRYCYQAIALANGHLVQPGADAWRAFLVRSALDPAGFSYGTTARPLVSVWTSALYTPALASLGLEAARWQSFVFVACGLVLLERTLRTNGAPGYGRLIPIVATACVALSVPVLAFARVVYPEAALFALTAAGLFATAHRRAVFLAAVAIALPFVHIRALPLSAAFVVLTICGTSWRSRLRANAGLAATYLAGMLVFVASQIALYGSAHGTAFSGYTPSLETIVPRLGMQLFDARHGIIPYWPAALVGFAGLLAGSLRDDRLCRVASVLLGTCVLTFAWATASESWTARYWVAAMPMLGVGIAAFFRYASSAVARALAALPIVLSLANLGLFVAQPVLFLANRRGSTSYYILSLTTNVDLGTLLPIDEGPDAGALPPFADPLPAAMLFFVAVVAGLAVAAALRSRRASALASLATFAVMLIPFADGYATPVLARAATVIQTARDGRSIAIATDGAAPPTERIRLDGLVGRFWSRPRYAPMFALRCIRSDLVLDAFATPSRPSLRFPTPCPGGATIEIAELGPGGAIFGSRTAVTLFAAPRLPFAANRPQGTPP